MTAHVDRVKVESSGVALHWLHASMFDYRSLQIERDHSRPRSESKRAKSPSREPMSSALANGEGNIDSRPRVRCCLSGVSLKLSKRTSSAVSWIEGSGQRRSRANAWHASTTRSVAALIHTGEDSVWFAPRMTVRLTFGARNVRRRRRSEATQLANSVAVRSFPLRMMCISPWNDLADVSMASR